MSLPLSRSCRLWCSPPSLVLQWRLGEVAFWEEVPVPQDLVPHFRNDVVLPLLVQLHWEFRRHVACCPSLLPGHLRRGPVSRGAFANPRALVSLTCCGVWPQATPPPPTRPPPKPAESTLCELKGPAGTTYPRGAGRTDDLSHSLSLSVSLSLSLSSFFLQGVGVVHATLKPSARPALTLCFVRGWLWGPL